jgi:hypothetical protein
LHEEGISKKIVEKWRKMDGKWENGENGEK